MQDLLNNDSAFEGGSNSIEDITKPRPKLKVGIVGYGPAGVITAIGLTKQGHEVTMFERLFYNYKDKADKSNQHRHLMYPVNIGAKGMRAINSLKCMHIMEKHLNVFEGMKNINGDWIFNEKRPCLMGCHLEIMWAF